MELFVGLLDKIRVLQSDPLLIRFTIELPNLEISCFATGVIANKVPLLSERKYTLKVEGHFNKKSQLVVKKISVINQDDDTLKLGI